MSLTITFAVLALLGVYITVMALIAKRTAVGKTTVSAYNVAERNVPGTMGGLSLAATWVWATALFVSSAQAYTNGWVGVLWFTIPNTLAILLMLPFALKLRRKYPTGLTLSGFMARRYGSSTGRLYVVALGGLAIMATAVNLLAGGAVLNLLVPLIPSALGSVLLAAGALIYTYRYGIRSSIGTGASQILFIIAGLAIAAAYSVSQAGSSNVLASLGGVSGINDFFSAEGRMVALTFGIVTAAGLLAGPVGDPTFWQRAFTYKEGGVTRAFLTSMGLFILVPLLMSVQGFVAVAEGITPPEVGGAQYVNLEVAVTLFPTWLLVMFLFLILSALLSTVNAQMIAAASLASDFTRDIERQRKVVAVGVFVAAAIAIIPGNTILSMFLVYSTLRSAHFFITVTTLLGAVWNRRGVFYGFLVGLLVGFPSAVYGNIINSAWQTKLIALAITTFTPILIAAVWTALSRSRGTRPPLETYRTPGEAEAIREDAERARSLRT